MARFTSNGALNVVLPTGDSLIGVAGATYRIPDSFVSEFQDEWVARIPGGVTWLTEDEFPLNLWVGPLDPRTAYTNVTVTAAHAYLSAFQVNRPVTVTTATFTVVTQSGSADIGIYNSARVRMGSSGEFAVPAAGQNSQALTAGVALLPGIVYYSAIACSSASAVFHGTMGTASGIVQLGLSDYATSVYPLSAGPLTITGGNSRTIALRWS